mgnify:CR=1 FL=1
MAGVRHGLVDGQGEGLALAEGRHDVARLERESGVGLAAGRALLRAAGAVLYGVGRWILKDEVSVGRGRTPKAQAPDQDTDRSRQPGC